MKTGELMFKANDALERAKAKLAASTQFIELHKAAAQKAVAAFNSAVAKIKEQEAELKDKEDLIAYLESREATFRCNHRRADEFFKSGVQDHRRGCLDGWRKRQLA